MARRDAERLAPAEAVPARLIEIARSGRRVVRVLSGSVSLADLRTLGGAGIVAEVLLAAPAS